MAIYRLKRFAMPMQNPNKMGTGGGLTGFAMRAIPTGMSISAVKQQSGQLKQLKEEAKQLNTI